MSNPGTGDGAAGGRFEFHDRHPTLANLRDEVLSGLRRSPKMIPPKFFYDALGSRLFDAITEVPEYYPTRTEIALLKSHAQEMAELIGPGAALIELGSGSSIKVRLIMEALKPRLYMPVDISRQHLIHSARSFAESFPGLMVEAVCADYSADFELPEISPQLHRAVFFPGSSIGNLEPEEAAALLERMGRMAGGGGHLLVGVDLRKDPALLNPAYDDVLGVTAAFNLNVLNHINRETGADFDLAAFRHKAFFNTERSRIEMHLVSQKAQHVRMNGETFSFAANESIHTENSYKYTVESFQQLGARAGFRPVTAWVDPKGLFSIHLLTREG